MSVWEEVWEAVLACVRDDVRAVFSVSEMICEGAGDGLCARRRWFLTRRKCFLAQRRSVRRVFAEHSFYAPSLRRVGLGRCVSKLKSAEAFRAKLKERLPLGRLYVVLQAI